MGEKFIYIHLRWYGPDIKGVSPMRLLKARCHDGIYHGIYHGIKLVRRILS
jgi:hypothetical protein